MPRTKEVKIEENEEKKVAKKATKTAAKKTTTKKATTTKKTTAKKSTTTAKKTTTKKTTAKKTTTKKAAAKTTKKVAPKPISARGRKKKVEVTEKVVNKPIIQVIEYYDLPYRYNETIVKVLAQTPNTLFIYWDISDADRENFVKQYGESFFNDTKPVLIIYNETKHYSFELDIDDFANSWYLYVSDSHSKYRVELARRKKYMDNNPINLENNFKHVVSSNTIDVPNDHILFDKNIKNVYFKDVKTNIITKKDITSISFLRNMGKLYKAYDLHVDFTDKNFEALKYAFDFSNPSSGNPTSTFK
jgi:hypothetical protein